LHELGRQSSDAFGLALRPAIFNGDVAAFNPAQLTKASREGRRPCAHIATLGPKTTIVGTLPGCCARVASGHAAAVPPINEMNSRRLIASPEAYEQ